ncbi:MAG TPA: HAD family hydrolase [Phycisphaerae bacterium]|nr:HAD family hydrolase [Phycisphaerae bacterium]HPS51984.1 HAD family hydrolase [Phycisphaerae bacterium]
MLSSYQLVAFDMDDTLYPERLFVKSGYDAVSELLQKRFSRQDNFSDWMWQRFLAGKTSGAFNAVNEQFNLGLNEKDILELVEIYRLHLPDISPYDDMRPLLKELRRHFLLGVVTDGPAAMQRNKFARLGLGGFFHSVVFTGDLPEGSSKPSTAPFLKIAEDLKVSNPSACVYVGDNPAKDFLGPNSLGWLTVQFHRPGQVHFHKPAPHGGLPQMTVSSAKELFAVLTCEME